MVAVSQGSTLRLWDVASGKPTRIIKGHEGSVSWVAFSRGGKQMVSHGTDDHIIRLWDVEIGNCVHQYVGHEAVAWMSCFYRSDQYIVSCSNDGTLRRWEVSLAASSSAEVLYSFGQHMQINALAISSDDKLISFATLGQILLLNTDTREIVMTLPISHSAPSPPIFQLSFSEDTTRLLSATWDGEVNLWDIASGDQGTPLELFHLNEDPGLQHLSFSQDQSSIFYSAGYRLIPQASRPLGAADNLTDASRFQVYYYLKDGWIWCALPEERRICWVPKQYRDFVDVRYTGQCAKAHTIAAQGSVIVFGSQSGQVTIIDLSRNPQ
jgi:WD40 repeat protein